MSAFRSSLVWLSAIEARLATVRRLRKHLRIFHYFLSILDAISSIALVVLLFRVVLFMFRHMLIMILKRNRSADVEICTLSAPSILR
jgi:hypothetical protein